MRGAYHGIYMPAAGPGDGHLLYMHEGTLFATGFDLDRLETKGQPVPVVGSVVANPALNGGAQVAVSAEGTLVYVPGDVTAAANPIDWVTPDGKRALLRAAKADWHNPSSRPTDTSSSSTSTTAINGISGSTTGDATPRRS